MHHLKTIKELAVIFVSSMPPIIIAYIHGGVELLVDVMKGMLAHKWIMYYTMAGALMFFLVAFLD